MPTQYYGDTMLQRGLTALLMRPSLLSGVVCIVATALILAIHTWQAFSKSVEPFSDSGPGVLIAAVSDTISSLSLSLSIALSQPWAYYALLVVAAVAIGFIVYAALQAATGLAADVSETLDEAHTSGEKFRQAFSETLGGRLVLRVIVAAFAALFLYLTITLLMPSCLHIWDIGVSTFGTPLSWAQCTLTAAGIFTILHVHIILIRLLFLRPRVFGSTYQILDAF